jgi:hypothetical protein
MRITLHDNLHASAGAPHPERRPGIDDATRAPWVRAMYDWIGPAPVDRPLVGAIDVGVGKLGMGVRRFGGAFAAFWTVAPGGRVVAASVLLAGRDSAEDDAALRDLRRHEPALPFCDADYAGLAGEPRPCLATLYLDATWYDNARVELVATSLALAAIFGPEGRMTVRPSPDATAPDRLSQSAGPTAPAPRAPAPAPAHPAGPLKFNFTSERLGVVMEMVKKKAAAATNGRPGVHFRAYPPPQFFELGGELPDHDVFDALADTTWWVRWYDEQYDRLTFGEFLGFVDQSLEVERAYRLALRGKLTAAGGVLNDSVWPQGGGDASGERPPVRLRRTLDTRLLVQDATIRRLFRAVRLDPIPRATRAARGTGRAAELYPAH